MTPRTQPPARALAGALTAAALLAVTAGCTGGGAADDAARTPLPSRSVGKQPMLKAKPVDTDVSVGKVAGGHLGRAQRQGLEKQISRLLSRYFDDAFLGGEYPRRSFTGALGTFAPGVARRAGADRDLLTNAAIGTTTEAVVPRAKRARLDVLAPRDRVVGLTARFRLVFVQKPTDGVDQQVTVSGRLLVNRKDSGAWQIFGYDVARSSEPASKGASR